MELLIFSDSHGKPDGMRRAIALQKRRPDAICFLGDGVYDTESQDFAPLLWYTVAGNCDWGSLAFGNPTERQLPLEGHTLLLTHGHLFGVKSGYGALISHAAKCGADIVLFGHTHCPHEETIPAGTVIGDVTLERPMYLFNPGSVGESGWVGTLVLTPETVLFSHGRV